MSPILLAPDVPIAIRGAAAAPDHGGSVPAVKKQTVEERRQEILEVTCEVVIERGFAGTRISDVAKRLDVSSSLIHYHFDSKEQLLAEAFAHYARKDLAEMEAEVHAAPTAIARLEAAIENSVPEGSDDVEWMLWIDGWGEALRNPMMKKISQELDEQSAELLERLITGGVDTGEFTCADPRAAAMRLTALVDGLAVQFAAHEGMMDRAQLIHHVRSLAAFEVGVPLEAFAHEITGDVSRFGPPGPATDAALHQLISRQADAWLRRDDETWLACWAADASWTTAGRPATGRDALLDTARGIRKGNTLCVEVPVLTVFDADEAAGTARGRLTVERRSRRANGKASTALLSHDDEYRRHAGGWLVTARRTTVVDDG